MKEIEARRSIRKYKSVEIDKKIVDRLIEGARLAPSGNNRQPWHFILVTNRETREKIARTAHSQTWMLTAPLFIVCIADIKARMESDDEFYVDEETASFELKRAIRDTSIAIGHILLEAAVWDWVPAGSAGTLRRKSVRSWEFLRINSSWE